MHRVIVIGSVNHDRIWTLDQPLVPGKRLQFSNQETNIGGGGFHTACQLLDLGAEVALVSRLMQDVYGTDALQQLRQMGFDTADVMIYPGETVLREILLEPSGERTIIAPPPSPSSLSASGLLGADAAYLNALLLDERLVADLDSIPLVLTQLPLRPASPRPSDYVITSRTDAAEDLETVWQSACHIAGPRLKTLILTDGPRQTTLFDGRTAVEIAPSTTVRVKSTIGAGDRFCGALVFSMLTGKDLATAVGDAGRSVAEWLLSRHEAEG